VKVVEFIVEASIATLNVTDTTLLRATLLALAEGLFAVITGVAGEEGFVGVDASSFLQPAVNNTAAAANTETIFFNLIIFVFINSRCWRTDVNNFHCTKMSSIAVFVLHKYRKALYNSHIMCFYGRG
jgi:hypothetical protein